MALHTNLEVWNQGIQLATATYKLTLNYPSEEKFGLVSQMRRASVSIPANIAEGSARRFKKEKLQFAHFALGSLAELETLYLISCQTSELVPNEEYHSLLVNQRKILSGFIRHLKTMDY